jgi:chorismate mutase
MKVRGVRGAITVETDTAEAIWSATGELLNALVTANDIQEDDVASIIFSTTPDLTACYPAREARRMGWHQTALMGFQEMDVPDGLKMCVRILIHWNTTKAQDEIVHCFMKGAAKLRPDLSDKSS